MKALLRSLTPGPPDLAASGNPVAEELLDTQVNTCASRRL